jgi:hypothetical protein
MPITYTVDRDQKLITEIWTGDVHGSDLGAYWTEYLKDPDVLKIRRTLVDLRQAVIHFNAYELSILVGNIVFPVVYDKRWKWKTAIVVGNTAQFKVSRQYQALAKYYSEDAIFDTVEQARNWLSGPESPES